MPSVCGAVLTRSSKAIPANANKPKLKSQSELSQDDIAALDVLCLPYVPLLRQVMQGHCFKAVFRYEAGFLFPLAEPVTFQFFHGCLMARVYYQNHCYAFPPLYRNDEGVLTWRNSSQGEKLSQSEFMQLPESLLLFFFNLLKLTFLQEPVLCPVEQTAIQYQLNQVGWPSYV